MNLLMRAIGGISDEHIAEFAFVQPQKKRVPLWVKIASAAACLTLAVTAVFVINNLVDKTDSGNNYNTIQPSLYFNDRFYVLDPVGEGCDKLPEGYVLVGEITSEDRNNKEVNGYGEMLRIGNKIYQNPDFMGDVYVYTTLFTGGERYWYLRFVDLETYKREAEERGVHVRW